MLPSIIGPRRTARSAQEEQKATNAVKNPKLNPAYFRASADLAQLDIPKNATIDIPNQKDITNFNIVVKPEADSYWHGGVYNFSFNIPNDYPYSPPKLTCNTKIFHPNIDLNGKVCLNILRQDWKPVLDINNVVLGLLFLFIEPNPNDPLNDEAADVMRKDKKKFGEFVRKTLRGLQYGEVYFPKMI